MEETRHGEERTYYVYSVYVCDNAWPRLQKRACARRLRKRSAAQKEERRDVTLRREETLRSNFAPRKRGGLVMTVYGVNRESTTLRCSPGEGGDWRETEEGKGGNVNSRQHVQPCKSDLGGQCSPCKQAIVVRRRESIGSPLSLG